MANSHAEAFAGIEGVDMVGAVDVDPKRAKDFAERHGIANTFTSLDEAIAFMANARANFCGVTDRQPN
eukprot:gene14980-18305_t